MDHKSINICENGFKYCARSNYLNLDVTALCFRSLFCRLQLHSMIFPVQNFQPQVILCDKLICWNVLYCYFIPIPLFQSMIVKTVCFMPEL